MAKKKDTEEVESGITEEASPQEAVIEEVKSQTEEVDAVAKRASEIVELYPLVGTLEGKVFDPNDPNHRIVAAFMVGKLGLLRRL